MNVTDAQERRRINGAILKHKLRQTRSSHESQLERDPLTEAAEIDDYEFMDSVIDQQQVEVPARPGTSNYSTNLIDRHLLAGTSNEKHENRYVLKPTKNGRIKQHTIHTAMNDIDPTKPSLDTVAEDESDGSIDKSSRNRRLVSPCILAPCPNTRGSSSKPHKNPDRKSVDSSKLNELAKDIKRHLSLPNDTPIPNSFFMKHRDKLGVLNKEPNFLTRSDRRQSLLDLGFGKSDTYSKLHVLGAGTYSIVYKGLSRLTNKVVALKEINLEREEGVPFTAIREVSLLKQLRHSNIITLHDVIYTRKTLTLVFEFVDRDLSRYMDECDHKIDMRNVKLYLFQLLRASKYCHDKKVLHRDIKPQNILISLTGELKLADFGLARAKSFPTKTYTDEVVTLWYRPPDVLLGNVDYGTCIDMWGVGCIFFEMSTGHTLFIGTAAKKQIGCIFEILGTPRETEWPGISMELKYNDIDLPHCPGRDLSSMAPRLDDHGIELMSMFLKYNPKQRVSASEALKHKYFSSLPPAVYDLSDTQSIFSISEIKIVEEQTNNISLHNVDV